MKVVEIKKGGGCSFKRIRQDHLRNAESEVTAGQPSESV